MSEIREVPGFPKYFVSNKGDVYSEYRRKKRIKLKLNKSVYGYLWVNLYKNKKSKRRSAHSLVLEAFRCKRPRGKFVNHINNKRDDNRLENLEWVTMKQNARHMVKQGRSLKGDLHPRKKITEKTIRKIMKELVFYSKKRSNSAALSAKYGISKCLIQKTARGLIWKHLNIKYKKEYKNKPLDRLKARGHWVEEKE